MIALDAILMAAVVVLIVLALTWAIVSDRRSKRASGGRVPPSEAPLHRNLTMPRELRTGRGIHMSARRGRTPR